MVLNDRPCSFNQWTMLLEHWTASPPPDFLTKFEVWIRIRNIPHNYYTIETMEELAKAIGKVREIAYDPKVSQRSDYIRAKVLFDTFKPARDEKVLNIKDADPVIISYEYEKIRKKCFHCYQLTHEKPQCPMLKKNYKKPILAITDVCNRGESSRQERKASSHLECYRWTPWIPHDVPGALCKGSVNGSPIHISS